MLASRLDYCSDHHRAFLCSYSFEIFSYMERFKAAELGMVRSDKFSLP